MKDFLDRYKKLNVTNLELLSEMYSDNIVFIDPAHRIEGLQKLTDYFYNLYQNIDYIAFDFREPLRMGDKGYVQWQMTFSHPRIGKGKDVVVDGTTFVLFNNDGKVIHHRDYFDLGNMLYQHLPILGPIVKTVNRRLGT